MNVNEVFFNQLMEKMLKNKNIFGVALCVESDNNKISWTGNGGSIKAGDKYFLTSVSKLCTSIMVYI